MGHNTPVTVYMHMYMCIVFSIGPCSIGTLGSSMSSTSLSKCVMYSTYIAHVIINVCVCVYGTYLTVDVHRM